MLERKPETMTAADEATIKGEIRRWYILWLAERRSEKKKVGKGKSKK